MLTKLIHWRVKEVSLIHQFIWEIVCLFVFQFDALNDTLIVFVFFAKLINWIEEMCEICIVYDSPT